MEKQSENTDDKIVELTSINPVDFYNKNCIDDVIALLLKKPCIEMAGKKALTYVKQHSDKNKRMLLIDRVNGCFEADMENGFGIPIGERYTAFMMLQKFIFKKSWVKAFSYVVFEKMNNKNEYMRIRYNYFKKIKKTDRYLVDRNPIVKWERTAIVDDRGRDFLASIPKFDDFTMFPDNKNYQRIVNNNYNMYHEFDHKPCKPEEYKGEEQWKWTNILIKHIFGEHYELGLKYMKILYEHPTQALPILVLISKERQTGKTTFINYMTILFGGNTIIINPEDIKSQFNGSYAEKNIIMIEESHFDTKQSLEKIKNLSTQKTLTVNNKFVAQYDIPFFGKIIITSNDENKFSKIDEEEIRYWVRKVPALTERTNHNILNDLKDEIPYFLHFLETLPEVDTSRHRMVFTPEEIQTEALESVKLESREQLHKEMLIYLDNHAEQNPTIERFYFTGINIKEVFFDRNNQYGISYINKVLKYNMELEKIEKTMRFVPLEKSGGFQDKIVGRPYVFENPYYDIDVDSEEVTKDGLVTKEDDIEF